MRLIAGAFTGGDGKELCATDHPLAGGTFFATSHRLLLTLNETSLEKMLLLTSQHLLMSVNLKVALRGMKLIVPPQLQFIAERFLSQHFVLALPTTMSTQYRNMGMLPDGYAVNHFLTDTDAFFIKTDAPNGFKHFERVTIKQHRWKLTLTLVTCDSRLVSVTALASHPRCDPGACCPSVHRALFKNNCTYC